MNSSELDRFPDIREQGETDVRQCQLVMIRMLHITDFLCEKHGVQYWLKEGTLLGAVRHQGFIPWDDDVDIMMLRPEYEKFVRLVVPDLPDDIFFQTPETDPEFKPTTQPIRSRLRDRYSCYYDLQQSRGYTWQMGLQIDIGICDRFAGPVHKYFYNLKPFKKLRSGFRGIYRRLTKNRYMKCHWWHLNPYTVFDVALLESDIFPLKRLPFEGRELSCPNNEHEFLTLCYGDYTRMPKSSEQVPKLGKSYAMRHSEHVESRRWKDRTDNL